MAQEPIRRSQLVAPFGVGAMLVVKGGTSVITAGLDHWYKRESGDNSNIDLDEFIVEEYRLQRLLDVHHFRLSPDYRTPLRGQKVPNSNLTIPFLRFPQWHVCSRCSRMQEFPLSRRGTYVKCDACSSEGRRGVMQQTVFVAMCERGHLQDFPWLEWVHGEASPSCRGTLRYITSGRASLGAQRVKCDCGKERSLARITEAEPDGKTYLSLSLDKSKEVFLCGGQRPWLGTTDGEPCEMHLRGAFRGATNVWFAQVLTAIYIPEGDSEASSGLVALLREPKISTSINVLSSAGAPVTPAILRQLYKLQFEPYRDEQIEAALRIVRGDMPEGWGGEGVPGEDPETAFRRAEFNVLRSTRQEPMLVTKPVDVSEYRGSAARYFSRVMLVHKLRETRAFGGFTRVYAETEMPLEERKRTLRREFPTGEYEWLPATVVYGEGIFLELREELIKKWQTQHSNALRVHLKTLVDNYRRLSQVRGLREKNLSPRFVLLHTLAHLLINRLTFECGYSTAALRERLYVSDSPSSPMAGLLIYTADGDSEGTMGGLVRMGKPGNFEPVLRRALESAQWCSADPVCREMGVGGGQGPDSCNLAACHSCALLPETSCEEFNRFLDRALVVNSLEESGVAFFGLAEEN
jgi:hypothetical protein